MCSRNGLGLDSGVRSVVLHTRCVSYKDGGGGEDEDAEKLVRGQINQTKWC